MAIKVNLKIGNVDTKASGKSSGKSNDGVKAPKAPEALHTSVDICTDVESDSLPVNNDVAIIPKTTPAPMGGDKVEEKVSTATAIALNKNIKLTNDQEIALKGLVEFARATTVDMPLRKLEGAAGTGKTFLMEYFVRYCGLPLSLIGLGAPTHKAAKVLSNVTNLEVHTIHSDLGLRLDTNADDFDINNPPYNPYSDAKIGNYQIYVLDESSMLTRGHRQYLEMLAKKSNTRIVYCGDGYQLPPPKETDSSAFKCCNGWALEQVVRQGDDNPLTDILMLLRSDIKKKTYTALEELVKHPIRYNADGTKGYEVFHDLEAFTERLVLSYSSSEYLKDTSKYKTLAYTNNAVNFYNKQIRDNTIKSTEIITQHDLLTSYTTMVNNFLVPIITNSEDYIVDAGGLANYYKDGYGKGYLIRLRSIYGGERTDAMFMLDHTDQATLNQYFNRLFTLYEAAMNAPKGHKSKHWVQYYNYKNGALCFTPLVTSRDKKFFADKTIGYGYALTIHKSQGSTYDECFVDALDITYDKFGVPYRDTEIVNRLLYVALSRARNKVYIRY